MAPTPPETNLVPRSEVGFWRWLASVGSGVIITGVLGLTNAIVVSGRDRQARQCEMASQIVTDDSLSISLPDRSRAKLAAHAATRVSNCLMEAL